MTRRFRNAAKAMLLALRGLDADEQLFLENDYLEHYHAERNHQGIGNCIRFPDGQIGYRNGKIKTSERFGGLLTYYYRDQEAI